MPLPDRLARANRWVTNPLMRTFAGRVPPFAIVVHRGRRSGRTYRTPVWAFTTGDGFVIALTYGADRDWVRNVETAGGCTLERGGRSIPCRAPRVVGEAEGSPLMPFPIRLVLPVLGVTEFLRLSRATR